MGVRASRAPSAELDLSFALERLAFRDFVDGGLATSLSLLAFTCTAPFDVTDDSKCDALFVVVWFDELLG